MALGPHELNASITAVVNALSARMTTSEAAYWGIVFSQIGSGLSALAALRELTEKDETADADTQSQGT